jgi:hypothetical protein
MELKAKPLGIIVLVILFGSIALTTAAGWWQSYPGKTPATFATGEAAGRANPADIRGSYTFGDISKAFGVPLDDLRVGFGLPAEGDASAFRVKELETTYAGLAAEGKAIDANSVRLFVALYTGSPFDVAGDIYLPAQAVRILTEKAKLTPDQAAYLQAHAVALP